MKHIGDQSDYRFSLFQGMDWYGSDMNAIEEIIDASGAYLPKAPIVEPIVKIPSCECRPFLDPKDIQHQLSSFFCFISRMMA